MIKLGGSLVSPYETAFKSLQDGKLPYDVEYAKELLEEVKTSGRKVVFVVGGGFLNRWYLHEFREKHFDRPETVSDFHYLGMAASDINATLFRILAGEIFGFDQVYPTVIKYSDYDKLPELAKDFDKYQVIVAAGWKPGHSHDVDTLLFAAQLKTSMVCSLKNIDGVYTADPKKDPTAVKKKTLTWPEYRAIIKENIHVPGMSFPIDAVAAKLGEESNIGFYVIDGRDMRAVRELLMENVTTRGTTVSA